MQVVYPPVSPKGEKQVLSPLHGNLRRPKSWLLQKSMTLLPVKEVSNTSGKIYIYCIYVIVYAEFVTYCYIYVCSASMSIVVIL